MALGVGVDYDKLVLTLVILKMMRDFFM